MVRYAHRLVPFQHNGAPTANYDGVDTAGVGKTFVVGDEVLDTSVSPPEIYECKANTTGAAVWDRIDDARFIDGYEVSISATPTDGYALIWNGSSSKWEPSTGIIVQTIPENKVLYIDYSIGNDSNPGTTRIAPKKTIAGVRDELKNKRYRNVSVIFLSDYDLNNDESIQDIYAKTQSAGGGTLGGTRFILSGDSGWTVIDDNSGNNYTADDHSKYYVGDTINANWTIDQYRGYTVELLGGTYAGYERTIQSNTANRLNLCFNFPADPGAVAFRIVRPKVSLSASSSRTLFLELDYEGLSLSYHKIIVQHLYFNGPIGIISSSRLDFGSCLWVNAGTADLIISNGGKLQDSTLGNVYTNPETFVQDLTNRAGCMMPNIRFNNCNNITLNNLVVDNVTINGLTGYFSVRTGSRLKKLVLNNVHPAYGYDYVSTPHIRGEVSLPIIIDSSTSSGLILKNSEIVIKEYVQINNCTSHAIECEDSKLQIFPVTGGTPLSGSDNGGAGLKVSNGSHVYFTKNAIPTVTGTVGEVSNDGTTQFDTWSNINTDGYATIINDMVLIKAVTP